ncbi:hypothetical protein C1H76_5824 [Elsinoe australis]|uniref:Uncharacterized protein n=1 Tax=Elsinoe australis TaxID=40998 RepID=A0A4V6DTT6_9PEZI|nr:hypothetical protein C1H76_5824 [Elsinoe australis]
MYPFQGNQPNGQQHAQPPPLKKHKTSSGAVVTYYPPPPGYVPPPNAQIPQAAWQAGQYQQSAWTPQQQAYYQQYYQQYAQAAGGYPSYPQANGWQHSQGYQHGYHQGQPQGQSMSQYSAQGYPAYGASNYSGYQNYQAPNQQQGNQWPTQPPQSGPSAGSPQQSTPDVSQGFAKPIAPASATYASQDRTSRAVSIATSNAGDSVAADDEYKPVHEFDETDYCREASYVKDGDSIPQNLSLGTIVYCPARAAKTALPATYQEAELDLLAPKVREGEDESISKYFVTSRLDTIDLSVRQIEEEWNEVKEDMIFRDYPPAHVADYIPVTQVVAERDRPDPDPSSRYPPVKEPTLDPSPPPALRTGDSEVAEKPSVNNPDSDEEDEAMDLGSDSEDGPSPQPSTSGRAESPADTDHMDDAPSESNAIKVDHDRHPKQNGFKDRAQEDALASLGVSGSPSSAADERSPLNGTPPIHQDQFQGRGVQPTGSGQHHHGPLGPPPAQGRHGEHRRSVGSRMPYGPYNVPPPPEPVDMENPWRNPENYGRRGSSASNTSQHTVPGGDFDDNSDHDKTPRAQPQQQQNGSGRKRGYEEMQHSNRHRGSRQEDDTTPRQRRFRPKVADAYSRRW